MTKVYIVRGNEQPPVVDCSKINKDATEMTVDPGAAFKSMAGVDQA